MQHLPRLSHTSARERIAEKFQMSEELLAALNPKRKFDEAGATITVLNAAAPKLSARVTRVQIDKDTQMLRAFGPDGALLAVYPVTAGSAEKPTPSETLKVTSINKNPTYRYNPAYEFKGVKSRKPFTINPGPNNPVGCRLDRSVVGGCRHSRHSGTRQDQQVRVAWLHPPDELGCDAARRCAEQGRPRRIQWNRAGCAGAIGCTQREGEDSQSLIVAVDFAAPWRARSLSFRDLSGFSLSPPLISYKKWTRLSAAV